MGPPARRPRGASLTGQQQLNQRRELITGQSHDKHRRIIMAVDMDKLQEFLGRFVTDLGATFAAGSVVTGHHLGLYHALAAGQASAAELAERTGTNARYVAEWLRGQAAGGTWNTTRPATSTR
jgi:Rv2258c-like winged HTH domain